MWDQLVALSVDFQSAPLEIRDRLALPSPAIPEHLHSLPDVFPERLILATCNRLEIYAVAPEGCNARGTLLSWLTSTSGLPAQTLAERAVVYGQRDAVRHLFRVAAGLESMVLGEPQILAQIRDALDLARGTGTAGSILQRLATDALRVGKRARTETSIARNRCSIAHVAVDAAASELHGLAGRRAMVIGAGKTGSLVAKLLHAGEVADLVILNRSPERGRQLARVAGGRFAPLVELPAELAVTELAITAVSVAQPVIRGPITGPANRPMPLLAIDLGVPRNIDPAVAVNPGIRLIDLDRLRSRAEARRRCYETEIQAVSVLADRAADDFLTWWRGRAAVVTITALRQRAEEIRLSELDHALAKLGHLSERDRNIVSALSVGLVNTLLHQPTRALREASQPQLTAETVQELFGLGPSPAADSSLDA